MVLKRVHPIGAMIKIIFRLFFLTQGAASEVSGKKNIKLCPGGQ